MIRVFTGDGSVRAKYTYYPGIDHPHSVVRGTQTGYFTTDQVGSVRALFHGAGQVLNQYACRPFGEMESVSEQIENPLRFTAREYDASTELYYYRNRWYDPQLGRFISEDPIGVAGGINAYAYVQNDPINHTDPMGLLCQRYTETEWVRRYSNGAWSPWRKVRERSTLVGDCFKEVEDVQDRKGGDGGEARGSTSREGPVACYLAIGSATTAAAARRVMADRYTRERGEYALTRERAARLHAVWSREALGSTEANQAYMWYEDAERDAAAAYQSMRDARVDLHFANAALAGAAAVVIIACGTIVSPG